MSHYFHIEKKSIFISMVLVKFLTIARGMYKTPSQRFPEHNPPARA